MSRLNFVLHITFFFILIFINILHAKATLQYDVGKHQLFLNDTFIGSGKNYITIIPKKYNIIIKGSDGEVLQKEKIRFNYFSNLKINKLHNRFQNTDHYSFQLSYFSSFNDYQTRKWSIGLNSGWNSLAGLGIKLSYDIYDHLKVDFGSGFGLAGIKYSSRINYLFSKSKFRPFVGLGLVYNAGGVQHKQQGKTYKYELHLSDLITLKKDEETTSKSKWVGLNEVNNEIETNPTTSFQTVIGFEYRFNKGYISFVTGYHDVQDKRLYDLTHGSLSESQKDKYENWFGSGYIFEISAGLLF